MEEVKDDIELFIKQPVVVFKLFLKVGTIGMLLALTGNIIALFLYSTFLLFALAIVVTLTVIMLICLFMYTRHIKQILINTAILWLSIPVAITYSYIISFVI
ncbi:hypothetical protein [Flavobacterium subsaxonicum]|uniref:hypothetical protein n=1 Tax=Flavobacterium subsaxonicum TaxID=426226 RepID=UPI000415EFC7|nr:hypothetical protein [Flavobacterium subsaxonicum]